ncbi:MAG TPA: porin family protein [Bryobacteraceae bacterium]|nr:porin family protein [Bryobacteraceae bacterium]
MARVAALLLIVALPAFSQGIGFGVKGGVPLTQYLETTRANTLRGGHDYSAATRRYTVGVTGEWWLSGHFGFAADLLYKRMGYVGLSSTFGAGRGTRSAFDVKGHSWELPVLAKRRFLEGPVRPFVAAGGILRIIGPVRAKGALTTFDLIAGTEVTTPIDTNQPSDLRKRWYPGLVIGGGVEASAGRARVVPEVRLAHWTANISSGESPGALRFPSNQVEVLLAVLF